MLGNILVGQSGGPTAAINSSLAGVYKGAKDSCINTVYGMRFGIEGFLNDTYIDLDDYIKSDQDIELLKRTPSSFLGSCRYKLPEYTKNEDVYIKLFRKFNDLDIKYVLYIGGNDSMDTIAKLSSYANKINSDIRFIGIPKTIDNDLAITDHTPGFGSAAKFIATTIKSIGADSRVYDINSVTIVEVMGRNAGWLTAASALAATDKHQGADLIYLPEAEFEIDEFIETVNNYVKERKSIVIAVSEGIKSKDGKYISESVSLEYAGNSDSFGHAALGGVCVTLSGIISRKLGIKSRGIELSTLQRCASHISSKTDIQEAYDVGKKGVECAIAGETGVMVTLTRLSTSPYIYGTSTADICKIANMEKIVPAEWIVSNGVLNTSEVNKYISPLICGELTPIIENGLPKYLYIK